MPRRRKKTTTTTIDFPFYQYLQYFLQAEHKRVYSAFTPLSKKFLNYNNPKENAKAYEERIEEPEDIRDEYELRGETRLLECEI